MTENKEKIVGIIGGMGPQATVDLMQRIIRATPALEDRDHIRCIVDNNPKVPSRIKAIIDGNGEDPGPCLADMAKRLEAWGADFIAIACNTAHVYYKAICQAVSIPVINMMDVVLFHLEQQYPGCLEVGILASPAIRITRLYEEKFNPAGIKVIFPDPEAEALLFDVIKKIKAGDLGPAVQKSYKRICSHLEDKGVTLAIIACTELSALAVQASLKTVDAAQILALKIVDMAK